MVLLRGSARIGCTLDDERRTALRVAPVPAPAVDALEVPRERRHRAATVEPEAAGWPGGGIDAAGRDVGDGEARAFAARAASYDFALGVGDHRTALEVAAVADWHPGERALDHAD